MAHYQLEYNLHLPEDKPWRKMARNRKRRVVAPAPEKLWVAAMSDLTDLLEFGSDATLKAGLIITMINHLPMSVRETIAAGIVDGRGLQLVAEDGKVHGSLERVFDGLPINGEQRLASGILVPA